MSEGINWLQMHKDVTTALTGDFPLICTEAVAGQSSTGKPMIKCKFKVASGQFAGRLLYHNFTISWDNPAAMRMHFSHMKALGLDEKFWATNPSYEQLAAALLQRQAIGTLGVRAYQGVDREEIQKWKPAEGAASGLPIGGPAAQALPIAVPVAAAVPVAVAQPSTPPPAEPVADEELSF